MTAFYAHTKSDANGRLLKPSEWEPLFSKDCGTLRNKPCEQCRNLDPQHGHLNKVAYLAGKFAGEMFPAGSKDARAATGWGHLVGWWHDLGKFSIEFQERLEGKRERANHSSAGAIHAYSKIPIIGQIASFLIAGHHAGLADWLGSDRSALHGRLHEKDLPEWRQHAPAILLNLEPPKQIPCSNKGPAIACFARFLFSCLVDADFIATEAFMNTKQSDRRPAWPSGLLPRMERALEERARAFGEPTTQVNRQRALVRADCLTAAERSQGFHTLTVPTGGGKTLSSLTFAIRHAIKHDLRRIIYVIPYTSIIEQNASEFRSTFSDLAASLPADLRESFVLEHHSNFESSESSGDEADERPVCRLAAENWDAPLIVTTSVQFFESLYANKTSRCRKLHNITRSVIILDEAQNLPANLLAPSLDILRQLKANAGCSIVFCTATQPAIGKRSQSGDPFNKIGLDLPPEREIIRNVPALFSALKRVTTFPCAEPLSNEKLVEHLRKHPRVLCVVNTKPHATKILEQLGQDDPENLHLSAQLCPEHRRAVLQEIHKREKANAPCRLIATTVVEAGVDIDFPMVFRSLTGLDSFAQAAGRCNRHGKLTNPQGQTVLGETVLFEPLEEKEPTFLKQAINASREVLPDQTDLLSPDTIRRFFESFYWKRGGEQGREWDKHEILGCFKVDSGEPKHPFGFSFRTAAESFRLIDDFQAPVIIEPTPDLWPGQDPAKSSEIRRLLECIRESHRRNFPPPRNAHRRLQAYTVQIPKILHERLCRDATIQIYHEQFPILSHPQDNYDPKLGLRTNTTNHRPNAFLV